MGGACSEERRLVERTRGLNFISTSRNKTAEMELGWELGN